jgi:hypothetical protein
MFNPAPATEGGKGSLTCDNLLSCTVTVYFRKYVCTGLTLQSINDLLRCIGEDVDAWDAYRGIGKPLELCIL